MDISKILSLCLVGDDGPDEKKESKEKAAKVVDNVIKKNKKTFDELAKL